MGIVVRCTGLINILILNIDIIRTYEVSVLYVYTRHRFVITLPAEVPVQNSTKPTTDSVQLHMFQIHWRRSKWPTTRGEIEVIHK